LKIGGENNVIVCISNDDLYRPAVLINLSWMMSVSDEMWIPRYFEMAITEISCILLTNYVYVTKTLMFQLKNGWVGQKVGVIWGCFYC